MADATSIETTLKEKRRFKPDPAFAKRANVPGQAAYRKLAAAGTVPAAATESLIQATRLMHNLTQVIRLCLEGAFDPATAPSGLKTLLARAGGAPDFAALERDVRETLANVEVQFKELIS